MPAEMPPPGPPSTTPEMPAGVPPGMSSDMPDEMPAEMPAPIPEVTPGPAPAPPPAGPASGLPPSLPAGLKAADGSPAGPLPTPIEDFSWLKASLKAAVDKEAVSAALQKAVTKQSAPARLLGAVRPRLAAAFSVQYTSTDCSEVAGFKGAFPGLATSSVCLICQPGGREAAEAAAAGGSLAQSAETAPASSGPAPVPSEVQAVSKRGRGGVGGTGVWRTAFWWYT